MSTSRNNSLNKMVIEYFSKLGLKLEDFTDKVKRILCIQPHPDDCDISSAGFLIDMSKKGKTIAYLTITDGSLGSSKPIDRNQLSITRRREQEDAGKVIGVDKYYWLNIEDGSLRYDPAIRDMIVKIIRDYKPDLILLPDPYARYEAHPDHRFTGLLSLEAVFYSTLLLYKMGELGKPWKTEYVLLYYTDKVNYVHVITPYIDLKLAALRKHRSQFMSEWDYFEKFFKETARITCMIYGVNAEYCEGFRLLHRRMLHIMPLQSLLPVYKSIL